MEIVQQTKSNFTSKLLLIIKYCTYPAGFFLFVYLFTKFSYTSGNPPDFEDLPAIGGLTLATMVIVFILEQIIPFNRKWNKYVWTDLNDIFNLVFSGSLPDSLARIILYIMVPRYLDAVNLQYDIWPHFLPFPLQVIFAIFLYDFNYYWYHRLFHKVPFLWRIHRLHHTSEKLTLSKTFRFNFIDVFLENIVLLGILKIFSTPTPVFVWVIACSNFPVLVQHANIDLRFPRFLDWLWVGPANHRIHHSSDPKEFNCNYSGFTLLWDMLFKTYKNGNDFNGTLGIKGHKLSWNYLGQQLDFLKP